MVRCVRYAFAHIPPRIGRVFFAREVALPFLRFRLLRCGYYRRGWPVRWWEVREVIDFLIYLPMSVRGWGWGGAYSFCAFLARVSWHLDGQGL